MKSLTNINTHLVVHTRTHRTIQDQWCNYFSFDVKNYSKSMRWKVLCSLSQELALFTSLQHIICSISHSQLFSLSYCHTYSTTVCHSMPHLTGQQRARACVQYIVWYFFPPVCLFVFILMPVAVWICRKMNLSGGAALTNVIMLYILLYPIYTLN